MVQENPALVRSVSAYSAVYSATGRFFIRELITPTTHHLAELGHWKPPSTASLVLYEEFEPGGKLMLPGTHGVAMVLDGEVDLFVGDEIFLANGHGMCLAYQADATTKFMLRARKKTRRLLVMSTEAAVSQVRHARQLVDEVPVIQRPFGIRLRSLWQHFGLPGDIGLEDVQLNDIAPRHYHAESDAVCYIESGHGLYACDVAGVPHICEVKEGDFIYIPATRFHGLKRLSDDFRFKSAQLRGIANDYVSEPGFEYDYPK